MEMNLRHAAALALVVWYLIAPPVRQPKGEAPYMDEHAKYRDWEILQVYKTSEECEIAQRRERSEVSLTDPDPWSAQLADAECIASDDLRIEGIVIKHPIN
jgi:hypothetical protein